MLEGGDMPPRLPRARASPSLSRCSRRRDAAREERLCSWACRLLEMVSI